MMDNNYSTTTSDLNLTENPANTDQINSYNNAYDNNINPNTRELNLSNLSEEERFLVLSVVKRDYNVRNSDKQRIETIQDDVQKQRSIRSLLSHGRNFNKNICLSCCSTFYTFINPKIICSICKHFFCKDCVVKLAKPSVFCFVGDDKSLCTTCYKERNLKTENTWMRKKFKNKFENFGSTKVIKSLLKSNYESQSEPGFMADHESVISISSIGLRYSTQHLHENFIYETFSNYKEVIDSVIQKTKEDFYKGKDVNGAKKLKIGKVSISLLLNALCDEILDKIQDDVKNNKENDIDNNKLKQIKDKDDQSNEKYNNKHPNEGYHENTYCSNAHADISSKHTTIQLEILKDFLKFQSCTDKYPKLDEFKRVDKAIDYASEQLIKKATSDTIDKYMLDDNNNILGNHSNWHDVNTYDLTDNDFEHLNKLTLEKSMCKFLPHFSSGNSQFQTHPNRQITDYNDDDIDDRYDDRNTFNNHNEPPLYSNEEGITQYLDANITNNSISTNLTETDINDEVSNIAKNTTDKFNLYNTNNIEKGVMDDIDNNDGYESDTLVKVEESNNNPKQLVERGTFILNKRVPYGINDGYGSLTNINNNKNSTNNNTNNKINNYEKKDKIEPMKEMSLDEIEERTFLKSLEDTDAVHNGNVSEDESVVSERTFNNLVNENILFLPDDDDIFNNITNVEKKNINKTKNNKVRKSSSTVSSKINGLAVGGEDEIWFNDSGVVVTGDGKVMVDGMRIDNEEEFLMESNNNNYKLKNNKTGIDNDDDDDENYDDENDDDENDDDENDENDDDEMKMDEVSLLMFKRRQSIEKDKFTSLQYTDDGKQVDQSTPASLSDPPRFLEQPSDQIVFVGCDVMIVCSLYGTLPLGVTWYKHSKDLIELDGSNDRYTFISNSVQNSIRIRNLTFEDKGYYMCMAYNKHGFCQKAFKLSVVEDKIKDETKLEINKVDVNECISLQIKNKDDIDGLGTNEKDSSSKTVETSFDCAFDEDNIYNENELDVEKVKENSYKKENGDDFTINGTYIMSTKLEKSMDSNTEEYEGTSDYVNGNADPEILSKTNNSINDSNSNQDYSNINLNNTNNKTTITKSVSVPPANGDEFSMRLDKLASKFNLKTFSEGDAYTVTNSFDSYRLIKVNKMNWHDEGYEGRLDDPFRPSSNNSTTCSVDSLRSLKKKVSNVGGLAAPSFDYNKKNIKSNGVESNTSSVFNYNSLEDKTSILTHKQNVKLKEGIADSSESPIKYVYTDEMISSDGSTKFKLSNSNKYKSVGGSKIDEEFSENILDESIHSDFDYYYTEGHKNRENGVKPKNIDCVKPSVNSDINTSLYRDKTQNNNISKNIPRTDQNTDRNTISSAYNSVTDNDSNNVSSMSSFDEALNFSDASLSSFGNYKPNNYKDDVIKSGVNYNFGGVKKGDRVSVSDLTKKYNSLSRISEGEKKKSKVPSYKLY